MVNVLENLVAVFVLFGGKVFAFFDSERRVNEVHVDVIQAQIFQGMLEILFNVFRPVALGR